MDMGEMFYSGASWEPAYTVIDEDGRAHYGRRPRVVELVVPMCCAKCEEKVRESLLELAGVQGVAVDPASQRVTVTGLVDSRRALKKARAVKRDAHLLALSPPLHHQSSFVHHPPASVHHQSYYRHTPAPFVHHQSYYRHTPAPFVHHQSYFRHTPAPFVHHVANPYYAKPLEYDGYWH